VGTSRPQPSVIDADAFNRFEARGWEGKAAGCDSFFAPITGRVIEPLLDAAGVQAGTRALELACGLDAADHTSASPPSEPESSRIQGNPQHRRHFRH
jgi:hypothetical protein